MHAYKCTCRITLAYVSCKRRCRYVDVTDCHTRRYTRTAICTQKQTLSLSLYLSFSLSLSHAFTHTHTQVTAAGDYQFCLKSADGSYAYVNGHLVISNGGRHAVKEKCHLMRLKTGMQQIKILYWRRHGTPYVLFTYQGPDTGQSKWPVPSDSSRIFETAHSPSVWLLRQWQVLVCVCVCVYVCFHVCMYDSFHFQ